MNPAAEITHSITPHIGAPMALTGFPASMKVASGSATVIEGDGPTWLLRTPGEVIACRLAASCLLRPAAGDHVFWVRDDEGKAWLTAVLVRASQSDAHIDLPCDTTLQTTSGGLTVRAADHLQLAGARVSIVAATMALAARIADVTVGQVNAAGQLLSMVFDRLFSFTKSQQRVIEGLDQVQATNIDYRATNVAAMDAEQVVVTGQRLVKLRGAQIHMG